MILTKGKKMKKLEMYKSKTFEDIGLDLHNGKPQYNVKNADYFFVGGYINCFWDYDSYHAQLYRFYSDDDFGVEENGFGKTPRQAINNLLEKFDMKLDVAQ